MAEVRFRSSLPYHLS